MAGRPNLSFLNDCTDLARLLLNHTEEGNTININDVALLPEGAKLMGNCFCDFVEDLVYEMDEGPIQGIVGFGADAALVSSIVTISANKSIRLKGVVAGTFDNSAFCFEGFKNFETGNRVVITTSVVFDGGKEIELVKQLGEAGIQTKAVLTVLDKNEGGADKIKAAGYHYMPLFSDSTIKQMSAMHLPRLDD